MPIGSREEMLKPIVHWKFQLSNKFGVLNTAKQSDMFLTRKRGMVVDYENRFKEK